VGDTPLVVEGEERVVDLLEHFVEFLF